MILQIIINQDEIELAIRDVVLSQISIREDQNIDVRFETIDSGDILGIIDVTKVEEETETGAAPKRRTRRTKAQIEADNKAAEEATKQEAYTKVRETETPAANQEADAGELPAAEEKTSSEGQTEDAKPEQASTPSTTAGNSPTFAGSASQAPVAVAMAEAAKIFPDATSSAPVAQAAENPGPKSLFANLTKPSNSVAA